MKEECLRRDRICQVHPSVGRHHHVLRLDVAVRQVRVVELLQSLYSQTTRSITSRHW